MITVEAEVCATLLGIAKNQGASLDAALVTHAVSSQLGPDAMAPHGIYALDTICDELLAVLSSHRIDYTEADAAALSEVVTKALKARAQSSSRS